MWLSLDYHDRGTGELPPYHSGVHIQLCSCGHPNPCLHRQCRITPCHPQMMPSKVKVKTPGLECHFPAHSVWVVVRLTWLLWPWWPREKCPAVLVLALASLALQIENTNSEKLKIPTIDPKTRLDSFLIKLLQQKKYRGAAKAVTTERYRSEQLKDFQARSCHVYGDLSGWAVKLSTGSPQWCSFDKLGVFSILPMLRSNDIRTSSPARSSSVRSHIWSRLRD